MARPLSVSAKLDLANNEITSLKTALHNVKRSNSELAGKLALLEATTAKPATPASLNLPQTLAAAGLPASLELCATPSDKRRWIACRRDYINARNGAVLEPATATDIAEYRSARRIAMDAAREAAMAGSERSVLAQF